MRKLIFSIILFIPLFTLAQTANKPVTVPVANAALAKGKAVYTQYCMPCHQSDGGGVQGLNPPLIKTIYVLGDQKRLVNIILKGLNQEIEIDGDIYANPMPALNFLTDQQVADVLTYVRNSFGNKATSIIPSQVKIIRAAK
jgi:mono/diheme cytochrome c family protein